MTTRSGPAAAAGVDEATSDTIASTPWPNDPFLEALFEHAPFGLALYDRCARFVRVNGALASVHRAPASAHAGKPIALVVPQLAGQIEPHVACVLRERRPVLGAALVDRASSRTFTAGYYPVTNDAQVLGAVSVVVDVTAQLAADKERVESLASERAAREQAEEANRTKDEFLATLSHELRTPLNAIIGWAHMLQSAELGPVERTRAVETIVRNAKLQANLVEDLLDVSRITTGKLRIEFERVQLGPVLEAAALGARPAAEAKLINLRLEVSRHLGEVTGDAHRLQQVVWNLVSNAIKFTPRLGSVVVRASRVGSNVLIEVEDTGQGIAPEFLPYLFERFRQADGSSARLHGGLGLGLAIVRHLVELHGGSVRAVSEGEGKGSLFSVTLPLAPNAERATPPVATPKPREPRLLRGASVLVVEDEPDARKMMEVLLCREGAEVLMAGSAAEAFELLRRHHPDVLVCDIGMPDQDGYSFLRQLRAMGEAAGGWVPALALTGYATPEDSSSALLSGFQMHLSKPIDPPRVLACIVKLWRRGTRDGER